MNQRFRRFSSWAFRSSSPGNWYTTVLLAGALAAGAFWIASELLETTRLVDGTAVRQISYVPNCTAARVMGVAPIYRGQPGYRPGLDADNDGIACEPYPF